MKTVTIILVFILFAGSAIPQDQITQTLRGVILDKNTGVPLPGANIIIIGSDPVVGTSSDVNGRFKIENLPIGRIGIKVTYIGFEDVVLTGLNLISGKELIIDISMEEIAVMSKEVVITASSDKSKPINEMAVVSSRAFTVEESERYAGSRNDVARMASNFAGVRGTDDSRNDIIIRGNSPSGLLWRLEEVDIPNPNHYGATESTGGPVSILNNNQLANSDFMTGAFPAEYGNAVSGVFDLKMRNGNDEKHEFLGQIGFNGLEFGAEGPVSKKNNSSYLVNYRYSTLELFDLLGVEFGTGTAIPKYQDFSFKVNLPNTKAGSFSVFGLGGKSDISFMNSEKDTSENKLDFYSGESFDLINGSDLAVLGISHRYLINNTTYTKFTLAVTYHNFHVVIDSISPTEHTILPYFRNSHKETKFFANMVINKKLNTRHTLRGGFTISRMNYEFTDSIYSDDYDRFDVITDFDGVSWLFQPYFLWQYKISNDLSLNSGLHYQQFFYNDTWFVEPRLGVNWKFKSNQSLSFGYGFHSQLAPITVYFDQTRLPDGSYYKPNKQLDMTRSQHFVLGYDWSPTSTIRLKTETYLQYITNAGVNGHEEDSYSVLNQGANFYVFSPDTLVNDGRGLNYGLEITLEKFLSNGLYYLVTGSLYNSKYSGSDGVWRNTAFNGGFVFNGLLGKEWTLGKDPEKRKKRQYLFLADIKATYAGGQRYTPATALQTGENDYVAIYDDDNAYSSQFTNYFRTDLRIAIKQNSRKIAMEWAIDIQNLFDIQNIYSQSFNTSTGETEYTYQMGLLIIPQFKIIF
jgi:hypothetical protein